MAIADYLEEHRVRLSSGGIVSGWMRLLLITFSLVFISTAGHAAATLSIQQTANAARGSTASLIVTISGNPTTFPVRVDYTTSNGTGTGGSDFASTSGTLTFGINATTSTISIPVFDNKSRADASVFYVVLSNPSAGNTIANAMSTVTITSAAAITMATGITGDVVHANRSGVAQIAVTRSGNTNVSASVSYATKDFGAHAGSDFIGASGTLTFLPGETTKSISVQILNNASQTGPAGFEVVLSNPSPGAVVVIDFTVVSIAAPPPTFSVPVSLNAQRLSTVTVTVTLTNGGTTSSSVGYTTNPPNFSGSAISGSDYAPISGTLTFAPGETSKTVSIQILNNIRQAQAAAFAFDLVNPSTGAALGNSRLVILIAAPLPVVPVAFDAGSSNASASRNSTVNLRVFASGGSASQYPVTVDYATHDGTGRAGSDYVAASGTISLGLPAGDATIPIQILDNRSQPNAATFSVVLSNTSNTATVGSPSTATVTIGASSVAQLSVPSTYVSTRANTAAISVTRAGIMSETVTVGYSTQDGSAKAGVDYTGVSGTLSFSANEASKIINVPILNNSAQPASSLFAVLLANPSSNAVISNGTVTVSIPAPTLTLSVPQTISTGKATNVIVPVTLSPASASPITISYSTQDGTARAGTDFTSSSGTLTFAPGDTSKQITIPVLNNSAQVNASTFTVNLTAPASSVSLGNATTTVSIDPRAVLRVGAVYSTAQGSSLSFLRFFNTGENSSTATITLFNYETGDQLGQWTSPAIPPNAELQFSVGDIESAANVSDPKPLYYSLVIQSGMTGYFQHVLYRPADGTLTNLSTCGSGVTAPSVQLGGVHSSLLSGGFPFSIFINNTAPAAQAATLGIYDARTGSRLGTYASPVIPAYGQGIAPVPTIEVAAGITPQAGMYHYVVKLEGTFSGFVQGLVNNIAAGVTTDMTTACHF